MQLRTIYHHNRILITGGVGFIKDYSARVKDESRLCVAHGTSWNRCSVGEIIRMVGANFESSELKIK